MAVIIRRFHCRVGLAAAALLVLAAAFCRYCLPLAIDETEEVGLIFCANLSQLECAQFCYIRGFP